MTLGGLHIFAGLFFLVVCAIITTAWFKLFYVVFVAAYKATGRVWSWCSGKKNTADGGESTPEKSKNPPAKILNKRLVSKVFIASIVCNLIIYNYLRYEWFGEDNSHYKAKEYWIAGQVVYTHRMVLGKLLHPENSFLVPYTCLQRIIYKLGIKYLPENDGEKHVWYNEWFLYPYARKYILPDNVSYWVYEPKMVALLDSCWQCMDGLMKKHISDKGMHKKYLLSFPALASYYTTYQGYYTGKFNGSGERTRTHPLYSKRNLKTLSWLDELHQKWIDEGYYEEIWQDYPFVANCWQLGVTDLLQDIALWLPTEGSFSCEHPIILRLYDQFQRDMSDDPKTNAILNLQKVNRRQAKLSYEDAVYSGQAAAGKYMLKEVCRKTMPSEKVLFHKQAASLDRFKMRADDVEYVFRVELKPLL